MSDSVSVAGSSVAGSTGASSVSSGSAVGPPPGSAGGSTGPQQGLGTNGRLLMLCMRGEWGSIESILRNAEKGDPEINRADEVSLFIIILIFFNGLVVIFGKVSVWRHHFFI